MSEIVLRDVAEDDVAVFFEQQRDEEANWMAASATADPSDRDAFEAKWRRILADDSLARQTILVDGVVAGNVVSWTSEEGERLVGYWIGKEFWDRGVATRALARFLDGVAHRPLRARVAADNLGSIRVLEKCGFERVGENPVFAEARGGEIDEYVYELR